MMVCSVISLWKSGIDIDCLKDQSNFGNWKESNPWPMQFQAPTTRSLRPRREDTTPPATVWAVEKHDLPAWCLCKNESKQRRRIIRSDARRSWGLMMMKNKLRRTGGMMRDDEGWQGMTRDEEGGWRGMMRDEIEDWCCIKKCKVTGRRDDTTPQATVWAVECRAAWSFMLPVQEWDVLCKRRQSDIWPN